MTAPAESFATFAQLARCGSCDTLLPAPPAPQVCVNCSTVAVVPPHSAWPRVLKMYLAWCALRRRFQPWHDKQEVWEQQLRDAVRGTTPHSEGYTGPNTLDALYVEAHKRALAWKAAGAPTDL